MELMVRCACLGMLGLAVDAGVARKSWPRRRLSRARCDTSPHHGILNPGHARAASLSMLATFLKPGRAAGDRGRAVTLTSSRNAEPWACARSLAVDAGDVPEVGRAAGGRGRAGRGRVPGAAGAAPPAAPVPRHRRLPAGLCAGAAQPRQGVRRYYLDD